MTAALGWALAQAPAFLVGFLAHVAGAAPGADPVIELQRHDAADGGFTDVEVRSSDVHVIIEAKRGWALPSDGQLRRYEARFADFAGTRQVFVVLTQNGVDALVRR